MRLEVLMEPTCLTIEYEERPLPPGQSYLEPVHHLFAFPSATLRSYLSDNLLDPDATTVRMRVGVTAELSDSSDLPLVDRAAAKRKAIEQAPPKRASKRRKTLFPWLFFMIPNKYT
jgi:hypothetical protein